MGLIAACALGAAGIAQAENRPAEKSEVVVAFGAEPQQVDPTRSSAGVDGYYMDLFYESLLAVTPEFERVPWLAESWQVIDGGDAEGGEKGEAAEGGEKGQAAEGGEKKITIAVKIRDGVKFHNGDTLTAHDFAYSYERLSDPVSRTAGRLRYVDGIRVHDDTRFDFVLNSPDGSLEALNLVLTAIPRKYYEEVGDAGVQAHPIGTGPWKFVSRKPREELVVERFEDYWNRDAMPVAKRLRIKIIPEDTTRVAAFKTGAVDWIDAVPPAQVAEFERLPGVKVASVPTPNNLYLSLNAIDPGSPLRFEKVRQAIAHAINVDDIIRYILYGQGIRTAQLAPGTLGYDPDLKPYPYDPARARELLAEAGFPGGVNVTCYNLTTPREPNFKEVGETIFAYLNEAGIRCRIVQLEYGAWIAVGRRFSRPHMDGIWSTMWGQGLPGDPADAWSGHVHTAGDGWGNYSYHADPELDAMIVQLRKTMDETQRIALIRAIAARKHEQVAGGFPTYRPMITLAWRDDVDFEPWPAAFWRSMRGMKGKAR